MTLRWRTSSIWTRAALLCKCGLAAHPAGKADFAGGTVHHALPAAEVTPAAGQGSAAAAEVLVQGIADLVLVFDEHAEILDYKTDRSVMPNITLTSTPRS